MTNEEAIKRIREHQIIHQTKEPRAIFITEALDIAIEALKAEPKRGKWIRDAENFSKYYCSECGFSYIPIGVPKDNFCPNCGSDNREVGNV